MKDNMRNIKNRAQMKVAVVLMVALALLGVVGSLIYYIATASPMISVGASIGLSVSALVALIVLRQHNRHI